MRESQTKYLIPAKVSRQTKVSQWKFPTENICYMESFLQPSIDINMMHREQEDLIMTLDEMEFKLEEKLSLVEDQTRGKKSKKIFGI